MDVILLDECWERCIHSLLPWAITPLVVLTIFWALWSQSGGVGRDVSIIQQELTEHATGEGTQIMENRESETKEERDMAMDAPSKEGSKDQTEEDTSLPLEEEAKT
jgi:hypothetical protein